MSTTTGNEQPGFEADVNELPTGTDNDFEETLEEHPGTDDDEAGELEQVQEEVAEQRKEGGYQ